MNLIQIYLPLHDRHERRFERSKYEGVEQELAGQFGGFTAYPRMPAVGLWQDGPAGPEQDELVIYEVLAEKIDRSWWSEYRKKLERQFHQDEIMVRAQRVEML